MALLGLSTALWASPGLAQTSTSITTSTTTALTTTDFTLSLQYQDADGVTWDDMSATQASTYLNQARCQCATKVRVLVTVASGSRSKLAALITTGGNAALYVGYDCATVNTATGTAQPECANSQLGSTLTDLSSLSANGSWAVPTTVAQLFSAATDCQQTLSTTIWFWIDTQGASAPDSGVSGSAAPTMPLALDGTPPLAPSGITVEGGDEALVVSWAALATTSDLAGYLVFCMRGDGLQVFNPSYYSYSSDYNNSSTTSQYLTSQILCPPGTPPTAAPFTSVAGKTTAEEVGAPSFFEDLDPKYLCSGLLPSTQTSLRLEILQNGIPYTVGVAAVDNKGNASPIGSGFVQEPVPTINFYQEYRDAGGQSPGGYCALAGRDAQLGAISLLAGIGLLALIVSDVAVGQGGRCLAACPCFCCCSPSVRCMHRRSLMKATNCR